jgi:hypothetical protein
MRRIKERNAKLKFFFSVYRLDFILSGSSKISSISLFDLFLTFGPFSFVLAEDFDGISLKISSK